MSTRDGRQFEAPSPVPPGGSPGSRKFHLYRLIVSLYEQLAALRVTAHTHSPAGDSEGVQFAALPLIPQAAEVVRHDELLHQQVVSLCEHVARLRASAHVHAATGAVTAAAGADGTRFDPPSPLPQGVSPGYKDEHLYREIVSLHDQLAAVRAAAHLHTAIGWRTAGNGPMSHASGAVRPNGEPGPGN